MHNFRRTLSRVMIEYDSFGGDVKLFGLQTELAKMRRTVKELSDRLDALMAEGAFPNPLKSHRQIYLYHLAEHAKKLCGRPCWTELAQLMNAWNSEAKSGSQELPVTPESLRMVYARSAQYFQMPGPADVPLGNSANQNL